MCRLPKGTLLGLMVLVGLLALACGGRQEPTPTPPPQPTEVPTAAPQPTEAPTAAPAPDAVALIQKGGCGACHVIQGVPTPRGL